LQGWRVRSLERNGLERGPARDRVKDWLAQPGPALLHVHANPMQLVMPFTQIEPAIGMALYSTRAILHGRGGDVWEMVKENFL
jgi:pyruvate dehydrogenase (quinone)